ncbi:TetR/AcrR family transcriptional regulator [Rhodococcus sp. NPDC127528]|uniref:TetR/AcrR family transcriptional regulator n=1 Tax=unclassified Rhodococcus (in: high G+C Gram-positive bacteria) TaxID=192944 RepID=UPI00362AE138
MAQSEERFPASGDTVRDAILTAAISIVADDGAAGLTVRRLAAAAYTSTMAVYTHYGSLGGVAGAVVDDGFVRLGRTMTAAPRSGDALADLFGIALAYLSFAREQPRLYTVMFQHSSPDWSPGRRTDVVSVGTPTDSRQGRAAFTTFLTALTRTEIDPDGDPGVHDTQRLALAAELWSALHGNAMLRIAGHLDSSDDTVAHSLLIALAAGNGVDRATAVRALDRARSARAGT